MKVRFFGAPGIDGLVILEEDHESFTLRLDTARHGSTWLDEPRGCLPPNLGYESAMSIFEFWMT
jgi:hypothetical protein